MKKILISTENLHCGGVEKCLIELLNNINYEKYQVDLMLFNEIGDLIESVNKNVKIKYIIPENKYSNKTINKIYKSIKTRIMRNYPKFINYEIRKEEYDVEIAYMHGYITKLISCIESKAIKIAWIHTDIDKCKVAKSYKLEKYLVKFNHIICVSQGVKVSVDKLSTCIKEKTKVIYNIIDKDRINKLANESINYEFKKNTIIGVGRFYEVKRFDLLIKAHKLLLDDGIENNLILVGYGGAEEEYRELIKKLEVEDSVDIVGFKENPYPFIKNSDIFVLSSDHEGLPTVICEAMTLGKPIVGTKCAGVKELIDSNKFGILVECGNEKELKDAIKLILLSEEKRIYFKEQSLKRSNIFNKFNVLKKFEKLIQD